MKSILVASVLGCSLALSVPASAGDDGRVVLGAIAGGIVGAAIASSPPARVYYAPPAYYPPPQAYYPPPPPVYYAPQPVYYAPPPVAVYPAPVTQYRYAPAWGGPRGYPVYERRWRGHHHYRDEHRGWHRNW